MGFIEERRQSIPDFVTPEVHSLESKLDRNHAQIMEMLRRMEDKIYTQVLERLTRLETKLQHVA